MTEKKKVTERQENLKKDKEKRKTKNSENKEIIKKG